MTVITGIRISIALKTTDQYLTSNGEIFTPTQVQYAVNATDNRLTREPAGTIIATLTDGTKSVLVAGDDRAKLPAPPAWFTSQAREMRQAVAK